MIRFRLSSPSSWRFCAVLVTLLAAAGTPDSARAQVTAGAPAATPERTPVPNGGIIEGIARSTDEAAPVALALVRLLPAGADTMRLDGAGAVAQTVTTVGGHFRFADVPAGRYRLQLARVGYRPVLSPALALEAGGVLAHELRIAAQPIVLAAVTVRGAPACFTADRISEEPALATIWEQARDGVELRRAFERQYRFVRVWDQETVIRRRFGGAHAKRKVDSVVSTPEGVEQRDRQAALERRAQGYQSGNRISVPDEKVLTDPEFLRDHCLEAELAHAEGLVGVRFRPTERRDASDVRGTLWLDAANYLARRLDVEWARGDERTAAGRVDYADVPVAGAVVRLPSGGHLTVERLSSTVARLLVTGAEATVTLTYRDFAPAVAVLR